MTTRERHKVVSGNCYIYRQTVTEEYLGVCTDPTHPHAKVKEEDYDETAENGRKREVEAKIAKSGKAPMPRRVKGP
jgi:hypothetical protein